MKLRTQYSKEDLKTLAETGLEQNYRDELAAQLGIEPQNVTPATVERVLTECLEEAKYKAILKDEAGNPRAVFSITEGGAISFAEAEGVTPHQRARWLRENKDLFHNLSVLMDVLPVCYSHAANTSADRVLKWFKFQRRPQNDITIGTGEFYYYEYRLPVADR